MTTYGQFCPVAKAAEVLCTRWTILVVRELLSGSSRFGDIQRGVPGCPPATLSKRLKELTAVGVVERVAGPDGVRYEVTECGWELYPLVEGLGTWGQRWVRSRYGPGELDVDLLLWDLRRFLDPRGLGVDEAVIELDVRVPSGGRRLFWMVVEPAGVDLCLVDPERPVDATIVTDVATLTQVWMGDVPVDEAVRTRALTLRGPSELCRRLPAWIGRHPVLGQVGPARVPPR